MSWRAPWRASKHYQTVTFTLAGALGLLLLSPGWIAGWDRWDDLGVLEDKLRDQQQMTASLRRQAEQLHRTMPAPNFTPTHPQMMMALASLSDLQFVRAHQEMQATTPRLAALQVQLMPMHFDLKGSWSAWLRWLEHWSTAAPGVVLSSLTMKANPLGMLDVQMVALAAQPSGAGAVRQTTPSKVATETSKEDPLDVRRWAHQKNQRMQAHPGYSQQVVPELLRMQEPLEHYAREHLQYVGQISWGKDVQALIRVPASSEAKFAEVHRVRVGSHAGHNFGRVSHIEFDHVVLDELMLDSRGEWQRQKVRLPLQERTP